jgi:hypothetical protein
MHPNLQQQWLRWKKNKRNCRRKKLYNTLFGIVRRRMWGGRVAWNFNLEDG